MSTHNMCFLAQIRKISVKYFLVVKIALSGAKSRAVSARHIKIRPCGFNEILFFFLQIFSQCFIVVVFSFDSVKTPLIGESAKAISNRGVIEHGVISEAPDKYDIQIRWYTPNFGTDGPEQTTWTQIRCCRTSCLIWIHTVCNSSNKF